MQKMQVQSLSSEDPVEKKVATRSSNLPGEYHGQRSLAGYSPWGYCKFSKGFINAVSLLERRGWVTSEIKA